MKFGMSIMPHEAISKAYYTNPPVSNTNIAASQISAENNIASTPVISLHETCHPTPSQWRIS
jgi:hypothetical protein